MLPEAVVRLERDIKKRAEITLKETVRILSVMIGMLPYVKITYLNRDANSEKSSFSGTFEIDNQPSKKPKQSGGKRSLALLKNLKQLRRLPIPGYRAAEIKVGFTEELLGIALTTTTYGKVYNGITDDETCRQPESEPIVCLRHWGQLGGRVAARVLPGASQHATPCPVPCD